MNGLKLFFASLPILALTILPVQADDTNLMSFGIGVYDIDGSAEATDFRIEFRSGKSLLLEHLKPWVGAEVTSDSSVWVGAGLLYDFQLGGLASGPQSRRRAL